MEIADWNEYTDFFKFEIKYRPHQEHPATWRMLEKTTVAFKKEI